MSNNIDSKAVATSVKIYERLLATYPADFRREYGPAMKQLFRDQCRDAWSEGQGRGLALLWLRVLPDWVQTSLLEHLRILHKRESMCRKIIRSFGSFRSDRRLQSAFIRMFAVVFVIAFVLSALVAYLSPRLYFSTATIEAEPDSPEALDQRPDPYFLTTQFKIIESYRVLTNVIVNLRLDEKLARQNGAARWSIDDSYEYLKNRLSVEQPRMTSLIEISARNPDANLAASIANTVADSYRKFRLDSWKQTKHRGIKALEEKLTNTFADLHSAETTLDAAAKANLKSQRRNYHQLETLLAREKAEDGQPNQNVVIVRNSAKASMNSVVQTKSALFLSWVLWGTLLALLAGGGSAWFAGQRSAR